MNTWIILMTAALSVAAPGANQLTGYMTVQAGSTREYTVEFWAAASKWPPKRITPASPPARHATSPSSL